jgi:hypothetical protein
MATSFWMMLVVSRPETMPAKLKVLELGVELDDEVDELPLPPRRLLSALLRELTDIAG